MAISWVLEADVNDGQFDALKAVMADLCDGAQNEEGTLAYEWFISEDDGKLHVYERYTDDAAVMTHMGGFAPHAERFMAAVTPSGFAVYGEVEDATREALAGLGAVHYGTFGGFHR